MTRTARRSMRELVDFGRSITVSRECGMQLPLHEVVPRMYSFLHDSSWGRGSFFNNFPANCCFNSSFFTGIVMERLGYEHVFWVFGYRELTGSHVWCEYKDMIIDLTSAQYTDCSNRYIFEKRTQGENTFTSSFQVIDKGEFDDRFRHTTQYSNMLDIVDQFLEMNKLSCINQ